MIHVNKPLEEGKAVEGLDSGRGLLRRNMQPR